MFMRILEIKSKERLFTIITIIGKYVVTGLTLSIFICCSSLKGHKSVPESISGVYKPDSFSERIVLHSDGTYELFRPESHHSPVIEQCDYASQGKWSFVADNVIEITSEDYYNRQKGFEYELIKDRRGSQDSLYIRVLFQSDFHPVSLTFTFNYDTSKSFTTDDTYIVLPKEGYLWDRRTATNLISFSLNAIVSGTKIYSGRIMFKYFEEYIDTERYNYLTINLPYFDRCFYEFVPYYQELIMIKNKNQLQWQGYVWRKINNE